MMDQLISELVAYGLENGLIDDADKSLRKESKVVQTKKQY